MLSLHKITCFVFSPLQMVVCPTHASLAQGAPAPPMALLGAASVPSATEGMASSAKTLTSVKRFRMLAIPIMEFIAVRIRSPATTVYRVLHDSLGLSHLEGESNRPLLRNRFEDLPSCYIVKTMTLSACISLIRCIFFPRFANPAIPARMVATTATKMQTASTWVSSPSPCFAASASRDTPATVAFAEKTVTWTDGPTETCCAWRMPPTTARR